MDAAPVNPDSLTPSQRQAVAARGNVLVMAGAGTGKTKTLVERCLDCLERDGARIDELLIVTFTEAAAAELRERLRKKLEDHAAALPDDPRWAEEIARFDLAHIGTLHGFCLKLIREHFYELGLDPRLTLLDEGESRQLADETLAEQFAAHYGGKKDFSAAVQELVQVHGGGRDENIRKLILRLHNYSQARPDAAGWLAGQRAQFSSPEPAGWLKWLLDAVANWRSEWLPVLENLRAENEKAAELANLLSRLEPETPRAAAAEILANVVAADLTANYPKKQATKLRPALGNIFKEAEFLASLATIKNGADPLAEDWLWGRGQMATLLRLAEEFAQSLAERKRADGVMDFHDLEQFALKLLWDPKSGRPSATAESWRAKLKFVFVDEYQDINAAQDRIIAGLARSAPLPGAAMTESPVARENSSTLPPPDIAAPGDGRTPQPNRFLVGDVKQSIYRFRLADPKIFRDYAQSWRAPAGETIPLSENFRSHESLLNLVNTVCRTVMRDEVGGVNYDRAAELQPGSAATRKGNPPVEPRAELLVRFKSGQNDVPSDEEDDLAGLDDAQREARLVVWRLKQFVAGQPEVFDKDRKTSRPIQWRDIAILLRSPRGKAEIFAKEFERLGVPLAVARGGFYQSVEILDLQSLLQLLDNPLQDVPCIAVLRSPFVGLSLDELAEIRLAAKEKHFWTALNHWAKAESGKRKAEMPAAVDNTRFPLTPALSPEERENRSPSSGKPLTGSCSNGSKQSEDVQQLSPLPAGEGQGEGERAANRRGDELAGKIATFLEQFASWRTLARQVSLSQCLEEILAETLYADWLRAQPRGAQRAGNVSAFLQLAQQFDQFQRQGLFRFLKFIEAQQAADVEPEVPAVATENAVRLMSIHQSKGLEFPVVVLADLAKQFNESDLRGDIIFDEEFGLCPKIKPPTAGGRYPSLPHWLAQRRQKRELRGEELRLLYVALTRAREYLFLTASVTEKNWQEKWLKPQPVTMQAIAGARSFADWLAMWFGTQNAACGAQNETAGALLELRWQIVTDAELADNLAATAGVQALACPPDRLKPDLQAAVVDLAPLKQRLEWNYLFAPATIRKAKSSVTALRREAEELDNEAEPLFKPRRVNPKSEIRNPKLSATETGVAHHKFLQHVALDKTGDLAADAGRLARENFLSAEECAVLDLQALQQFWDSPLGQNIAAQAANVRRELPFTARFSPAEIAVVIGKPAEAGLENEFIVVQGVADLVVLMPEEIWLVDFKTDEVAPSDLADKVKIYTPQLRLYAAALEKIFGRKVTRRALHFLAARRTVEI